MTNSAAYHSILYLECLWASANVLEGLAGLSECVSVDIVGVDARLGVEAYKAVFLSSLIGSIVLTGLQYVLV